MYNFEIQKIHNTVWVFKNALKNSQEVIEYFEKNREWSDWYTFGKMTFGTGNNFIFNTFPTQEEWDNEFNKNYQLDNEESKITREIDTLFYEATKLYLEENNVLLNNWIYQGWNVAKYQPNGNEHSYVMHHHTDFQRELAYQPGIKFGVTAVFYLNDNYEGGEVEFRFVEDESLEVVKEDYTYKPSAGDIVVFLSGHPHYHGVKAVTSGEKYIIRTYWRFDQPAHPKWIELKEKYGDAWEDLERERLRYSRSGDTCPIVNNIPKFIGFEDYYNKLENGEIVSQQ